jgi:hypothetical protein
MINDRGLKKWQGFFMPEHTALVKEELENQKKIEKQILDESQIADMEATIMLGMEYAWFMHFKIYKEGNISSIVGRTAFIDYIKKEFRIFDQQDNIHHVHFQALVNVEKF